MAGGLDMDPSAIELLLRRVHSGEVSVFNLPVDLYKKLGAKLSGAVKDGFKLNWDKVPLDSPDWETVRAMKNNTYVFSAAKTFQQINDMTNALFDKNGMARPFRLFEKDAQKIFDTYNKTWLKAEYATAKEAGRAAKRWNRIQETADIYPYLEYRTRRDSRVRPEHAEIDGVLLPVTDPFWDTHTPPNGWGCNNRCRLIKRRDPKADEITQIEKQKLDPKDVPGDLAPEVFIRHRPGRKPIEIAPNPKLFNLNFGKEKLVFPDSSKGLGITSHPYFRVHRRFKTLKDNNFNMPMPAELQPPAPTPPKPKPMPASPEKRLEAAKRKIKKLKPIKDRLAQSEDNWAKLRDKRDVLINEILAMPSGPEKDKKTAEMQKIAGRYSDLDKAQDKVKQKYAQDVADILAQPTKAQIVANETAGIKHIRTSYDIGKDGFAKVVGDRPALRGAKIKATLKGGGRANFKRFHFKMDPDGQDYKKMGPTVNYSRDETPEVIAHELAHWLEYEDRDYFEGVKAFYKRRTKGYITERLKDRNPRYGANERTNADTFINAYTGKIYRDATEITPMFFTHSFTDIHEFIRKDQDHFDSIYKLLNTY